MSSKKVCYVTTIPLTLKAFVLNTAIYIHEHSDYDITFICSPEDGFAESLPEYIHYIPVTMKRGVGFDGLKVIHQLTKIFKEEKFDLVQYSTPNAAVYASIAAKRAKVPNRVYCQWGISYVRFSGALRWAFKQLEKKVCASSTVVEPDSFGNLNFSHEEGLYDSSKSRVIWNGSASGVNVQKFDRSYKEEWRKQIREEYHIPENAFVYGFVGRVTRDKGVNELFAAYKNILSVYPDSYLMLVGMADSTDTLDQELYNWAKNESHVIFTGHTNVVEQYVSAMDVYVLPSYREGFGSSIIEAEAMGVPVIVTRIPGPLNAMEENKTGLVVELKDVNSLQKAMKEIYTNTSLREEFGNNAYVFATGKFEQQQLFAYILQDRKAILEGGSI